MKNGLALFQEIYFYGPQIDDAFMAESKETLNGLQEINLFGTGLTDEGLKHLAEVQSLTTVRIAQKGLTPEGIDAFREALPNVTIAAVGEAGWSFIKPWGGATGSSTMP